MELKQPVAVFSLGDEPAAARSAAVVLEVGVDSHKIRRNLLSQEDLAELSTPASR